MDWLFLFQASSFRKLRRIKEQMGEGYYSRTDVLKDVADALIMNPGPFENLNEKDM